MGVSKVVYGGKTLIDLTGDTVTEDKLLKGATAAWKRWRSCHRSVHV